MVASKTSHTALTKPDFSIFYGNITAWTQIYAFSAADTVLRNGKIVCDHMPVCFIPFIIPPLCFLFRGNMNVIPAN